MMFLTCLQQADLMAIKICQSQLIKMETEYGRQPAQKSFTEQYFELQDVDCQSHLSERETEK